ncbi:D-alanyl-D-alanine carboxypeptidase/D-alanyl-D-alanine-endopeptidase [Pedobacter sp. SD-b]|uniref:D-alanyl-D-alanine carboxypeptidase/D-alanyl-D-alanine-endopeptidase n=1 Tax=Pedobacter segetis TaxID=2793069 RepID=A0ABS1BLI3_9SPHI|nr:D-alanyl-D-alanine carboxypeptidase/D-alanyl-D-alanine-endopeptidase [Pedobacter segetis]MBK0383748.1 D-alanyl-D-alanine carboxypeptidase/D-alanyl-D-alanine-endopeptidase [Pedobacter segetis]
MKKPITIIFSFLIITASAKDQTLPIKIKKAFENLLSNNQLKYATVSFSVLNATNGELVFGDKQNIGVATASTLKTITSATALALLGQDFTFSTQIAYSGEVLNSVLNGNLIIKGGGDPTLGSPRWDKTKKSQILNKVLFALQQKGIKSINGKVLADVSDWDTQSLPIGWIWQDIGNYYAAGTSQLCWGENLFDLSFTVGKTEGSSVKINNPAIYPFLNITNELTTGANGSGDNVYAYSAPYTSEIYLRGTYAKDLNKDIGISLPDPALAMAYDVADFLNKNGFETKPSAAAKTIEKQVDLKPLSTIVSPPLKEIVYYLNKKSINLYAEQLLRTIGYKFGKNTSTKEGVKTMQKFWAAKGIDDASLNVVDGSGLSPQDRVTTLTMAKVLYEAKKENWFDSYFSSLPIYNGLHMKSGTITDVLAYAGYVDPEGKTPLCFSLIINNYNGSSATMRQKMFGLLDSLK